MIRKQVFGCAIALMAMLLPAAAQAQGQLELLQPGKLSCGADGGYPPFSFTNEKGEFDGLEVRVMKEMARRAGLEYAPVVVKFDSALVGLMSNQYDVLCNVLDITAERQKQVRFLDGWLESGGRLLVSKDAKISKPEEFTGVIGVLASSTWAKLAETLKAKETKYYKVEVDALRDLVNGNIDGMITDAIVGAWGIQKSALPIKATEGYLSHVQKGFAIRKDKPNLAKALNKALSDMLADGTYQKMTSEIIGYSPHPKEPIRSEF
jgi:polar amino acid transport system substrate-binding protein